VLGSRLRTRRISRSSPRAPSSSPRPAPRSPCMPSRSTTPLEHGQGLGCASGAPAAFTAEVIGGGDHKVRSMRSYAAAFCLSVPLLLAKSTSGGGVKGLSNACFCRIRERISMDQVQVKVPAGSTRVKGVARHGHSRTRPAGQCDPFWRQGRSPVTVCMQFGFGKGTMPRSCRARPGKRLCADMQGERNTALASKGQQSFRQRRSKTSLRRRGSSSKQEERCCPILFRRECGLGRVVWPNPAHLHSPIWQVRVIVS
jgi:hypothetical protein